MILSSANCAKEKIIIPYFLRAVGGPKDNIGNYTYRIGPDNAPALDGHGHMIVEHDLDEIADAFIAWSKTQKLSFVAGGK